MLSAAFDAEVEKYEGCIELVLLRIGCTLVLAIPSAPALLNAAFIRVCSSGGADGELGNQNGFSSSNEMIFSCHSSSSMSVW